MTFLRDSKGSLVAIWDIRKIHDFEREDGSHRRGSMRDGEIIELARDYSLPALAKGPGPHKSQPMNDPYLPAGTDLHEKYGLSHTGHDIYDFDLRRGDGGDPAIADLHGVS